MSLGTALVRAGIGLLLLASFACGAIIAEDVQPTGDTPDASAFDGSAVDATTGDAHVPPSACALPRGPRCALGACERRTLYAPASKTSPHGIVSDASFVYWLEQPATPEGYNGHARARLLRADKLGALDTSHSTTLAVEQEGAVALALDGGWVYWTVYELPDGAAPFARLLRVRVDGGMPEDVATLAPGIRIRRLERVAPGVLFGLSSGGHVYRFDLDPAGKVDTRTIIEKDGLPSVVAIDDHVYAASLGDPTVARIDLRGPSVQPSFFTIPHRDGLDVGFSTMWTDCSFIWATRGPNSLVRLTLADGGLDTVVDDLMLSVFGMTGDADFLYIAGANEGVRAIDRRTSALTVVSGGKAFAVAVDADGVYWGEHRSEADDAGSIYMLVK